MVGNRLPVLVLAAGSGRVHPGKVAAVLSEVWALKVARRAVRLAKPAECRDIFGYEPGSFPPIGHEAALRPRAAKEAEAAEGQGAAEEAGAMAQAAGAGPPEAKKKMKKMKKKVVAVGSPITIISAALELHWLQAQQGSADAAAAAHVAAAAGAGASAATGKRRANPWLYCGGGTADTMIRLSFEELSAAATAAVVAAVSDGDDVPAALRAPHAPGTAGRAKPKSKPAETAPGGDDAGLAARGRGFWTTGAAAEVSAVVMAQPQLLLDGSLGRLCRWLRVVGVDAEFDAKAGRDEVAQRALASGRVLVTRDRKVLRRREPIGLFFTPSHDTGRQFKDLVLHFGIQCDSTGMMSRCAQCNSLGFFLWTREQMRARPQCAEQVPSKVVDAVDEFYECRKCSKLFWTGPIYMESRERFRQLVKEARGDPREDQD